MVANIRGFTTNYAFKLVNFDTPRWHTLEYSNWQQLDAILKLTNVPQMRGEWSNSTAYLVGDRVIDVIDGHVYRALVQHTSSAPPVEFADERIAHSNYWVVQIPGVPLYRGEWTPNTTYALGDIVKIITPPATVAYQYQLCINAHTSNIGTFPVDVAYWTLVFDATNVVLDTQEAASEAAASASEAASSATVANDAAVDAATAADAAQEAADAAAESAGNALSAQGAFRWNFVNLQAVADPGAGNHTYNNINPALATKLSISGTTADPGAPNVQNWLMTWDDSTSLPTKGTIYVRKSGFPDNFFIYNIIGVAVNHTTWVEFDIEFIAQFGLVQPGEQTTIGFSRTGNAGNPGPGTGDMLGSNNLSDVAFAPTARANLGVGAAQSPTFAQVLLTSDPAQPTHAVTLGYLEDNVSDLVQTKVDKLGDEMTGLLSINVGVEVDPALDINYPNSRIYTGSPYVDIEAYNDDPYNGAALWLGRSRGSVDAKLPIAINDLTGYIAFFGYTGPGHWPAPTKISGVVDGTPSGDTLPIALTFETNSLERLRIQSDGSAIFTGNIQTSMSAYVTGSLSAGVVECKYDATRGTYYFGNSANNKYLTYDGNNFVFNGGSVYAPTLVSRGDVWTGNSGPGGTYRFGNSINNYLTFDGSAGYFLVGGSLSINNGNLQVGSGSTTGTVFLGSSGTRYLSWDGSSYVFPVAPLSVGGRITANNDVMTCYAGNAATGTVFFGNSGAVYLTWNGSTFGFTHQVGIPTLNVTNINFNTGQFQINQQPASVYQAGPGGIQINAYSTAGYDAFISYHRPGGGYAANMGLMNDNRFGFGGWSVGGGVQYRFWSREDFGEAPVHNTRLVYVGDYVHSSDEGLTEPYGPTACQTGGSGANLSGFGGSYLTQRYRVLQVRQVSGYYGSEAA